MIKQENLNLESIERLIDDSADYFDVHMHTFFYLMKFYYDNLPEEAQEDFLEEMNKLANQTKVHSFFDHMKLYADLLDFYKTNAEYTDFIKLQTMTLSFLQSMREELEGIKQ